MTTTNDIKSTLPPEDDFWVLAESSCYLKGRGVTFGPPLVPAQALAQGVYSIAIGVQRQAGVAGVDKDLQVIADGSLDHLMITPQIAAVDDPVRFLREATRKLKLGGHLIILTEVNRHDPGLIMFNPEMTRVVLTEIGKWLVKSDVAQNGKHLMILKRIQGKRGLVPMAIQTKPTVCIARYGALGDGIIMTPLIRQLANDGYHVTLNISGYCAPVFEGNPHVGNLLIQEKDLIPNHLLGRYWRYWRDKYSRYINLSESIEGDLLMVEGRGPFFTTKAWRHERANRNYTDYTLERGGYGPLARGQRGELFFTQAERRRAVSYFKDLQGKHVILWALNGSSHHKVYPLMEATLRDWLPRNPEARVILCGEGRASALVFQHPQVINQVDKWSIREALIATEYVQCVVGPETMITNAAGCGPTPVITLLSHSTHENLCKHWINDYCLTPDVQDAPCYPCHQLHYSAESCPQGGIQDVGTGENLGVAPVCTLAISPERVMTRLDEVYEYQRTTRTSSSLATQA